MTDISTALVSVEETTAEQTSLASELSHEVRIREYTVRIEALTAEIAILKEKSEPIQKRLQTFTLEANIKMRTLLREDQNCNTKLLMFETLQIEYSTLIEKAAYNKLYEEKRQSLLSLLDDISQIELDLLQVELQRLNEEIVLQPLLNEIVQLKEEQRNLQLEKEHFTATYLNHLQRTALPSLTRQ